MSLNPDMSEAAEPTTTENSVSVAKDNIEHDLKVESDDASHSDAHTHPHPHARRRSSSGGSKHDKTVFDSEHKPTVEFVRPTEGTPAAEALAGNLKHLTEHVY